MNFIPFAHNLNASKCIAIIILKVINGCFIYDFKSCLVLNSLLTPSCEAYKILYASQDGVRSDFSTKQLVKSYLKHPVMTFKIILAIHFEAFKLWAKGIKFIKKKIKIKNNITIEN